MKPERLEHIDNLFQAALDLEPGSRAGFLETACGGDPELRAEVESLLAAHQKAGHFIEDSASDVAASLIQKDPRRPRQVGHYKIEKLIGAALEGQFLIHAGRVDEALGRLQKTFEMGPNFYLARLFAASAYIEKGMFPEAIAEAQKARAMSGPTNSHPIGFLGYALARAGRQQEARALLDELIESSKQRYVAPYNIALI